jgi:hypothetical protein
MSVLVILAAILLIDPVNSYISVSSNGWIHRLDVPAGAQSSTLVAASSIMPPADLTPAIDKFIKLPAPDFTITTPYFMTARGPSPTGPDPFGLVAEELQPLSDYVKELVVSENPVLTMAASHFFEQVRRRRNMLDDIVKCMASSWISSLRFLF